MTRSRTLLGVLAVLFGVSTAPAQPPRGPGGFGPGGMGGPRTAGVLLLGAPEVRKELATSDGQNMQIDELLAELQGQMRASFGNINFQELQTLNPEERQKRFEEVRKKSEEAGRKADEKLAQILDAKQRARLRQLRLQREGVQAFQRPEVVRELALTDEQRQKLGSMQPGGGGPFPPGPEAREKALADALALLTQEQKAKWAELKGKEFKFPPPRGGFGPGGPMGQQRKLVKQFDKDGDGRLNAAERKAARESLKKDRGAGGRGGFGPGGPGGFGPPPGFAGRANREPAKPGPHVAPADVKAYPEGGLYEPTVLRTLFLDFEDKDWEAELEDFHGSDVEIPATLTVDGKKYAHVGAHFRGMSSYMMVRAGHKRSLNLSLDFVDAKQRLYGYKTLNLLNSHDDPAMMSTVLYSHLARQYIPAPKANFVKLVINGESWGVYVNVQQFNKDFVKENYQTTKGARWKVRGSPGGGGGLDYLGDNVADYKRRYQIKSADDPKAWQALIALCKTLNQTPPERLEEALSPILDLDGLLWFLALDVVLINGDGYWIRASDYSLYRDPKGKFHVVPHDMNEAFRPAGGPGFRPGGFGGQAGPGAGERSRVELDPLVGLTDARKPLRSKVLAVPALRKRYLQHVHTLAEEALDWRKLGPVVARYRSLIEKEVEADTRKLDSLAEFRKLTAEEAAPAEAGGRPGRPSLSLRAFADQRRKYLLENPEVQKAVTRR